MIGATFSEIGGLYNISIPDNIQPTMATFSAMDGIYDQYKQTSDKNIFEDVIIELMINFLKLKLNLNDDFIKKLKSLPTQEKRHVILGLMEGQHHGIFNELSELNGFEYSDGKWIDLKRNQVSKIEYIQRIVKLLREYVKVGEVEKKEYGEVMTPLELVKDMINTLPEEVWSDPTLKWLDPANGTGQFPALVIYKLMHGLSNWEPDPDKRYKHIIEKMIYVCEIQCKNMFLWLCAIDYRDEYECNIYLGSFLDKGFDHHMREVWKVDKFDIVLGNPPYNDAQKITQGKRGGGSNLWDKFTIKSIDLLKVNGYLNFVHPTLWRKPQSERSSSRHVNKLMMNKQIHYLEMHDSEDGMKVFNAGTRFDFYLLENCPIYKDTKIKDELGEITLLNLKGYDFIPNFNIDFFNKIKSDKIENYIIFNRTNYGSDKDYVNSERDDIFKYPLIHSTPKSGVRWKYSSLNNKGHFGISKVIFGDSGINEVIIDMNGEYGMTQHAMGIKVDNLSEAENIKNALESDKFNIFLKSCMWSNFQIDWRLFNHLRKDFYKEFI